MSRPSRLRDTDIWPDNRKEWAVSLVFVGGFLITVLLLLVYPAVFQIVGQFLWGILAPGSGGVGSPGSQVLQIPSDDVQFLNRNFRHHTHMQAYCGLINDAGQMEAWAADIDRSSPTGVSFSVHNCPLQEYPAWAVVLTHPNGNPAPTDADRDAFGSVDASYLCIQSGLITSSDESAANLRCYRPTAGSLEPIPVRTT